MSVTVVLQADAGWPYVLDQTLKQFETYVNDFNVHLDKAKVKKLCSKRIKKKREKNITSSE